MMQNDDADADDKDTTHRTRTNQLTNTQMKIA